jgi:hypothetical protein
LSLDLVGTASYVCRGKTSVATTISASGPGVILSAFPAITHPSAYAMSSDAFQARTLKRKNVKGLALSAPPKAANPSEGDSQIPGAIGNQASERTDTLEIGLEFKLDLRSEDLIVLKELGAGNGGTVSKVMHATTKVVMARKVDSSYVGGGGCILTCFRSSE